MFIKISFLTILKKTCFFIQDQPGITGLACWRVNINLTKYKLRQNRIFVPTPKVVWIIFNTNFNTFLFACLKNLTHFFIFNRKFLDFLTKKCWLFFSTKFFNTFFAFFNAKFWDCVNKKCFEHKICAFSENFDFLGNFFVLKNSC